MSMSRSGKRRLDLSQELHQFHEDSFLMIHVIRNLFILVATKKTAQGGVFMRHHKGSALFALLAIFALVSIPAAAQQPCENLMSLELPHVTITSAKAISPGWEVPSSTLQFGTRPGLKVTVPFCRVEAYSAPSSDSHIAMEVWLPSAANWNGRLLAGGNPGMVGDLALGGLANMVAKGYAAAATDTGHRDDGYAWAIGHPEKVVDWGHRAMHELAVFAKRAVQEYYGQPAKHAYMNSCHNGGNQALNEAQRYPGDFDGIAAGDPAFYLSHIQSGSLYLSWVSLKDGEKAPGYIPPAKYPAMTRSALDTCDAKDGLVDGIIENPPACHYDPKVMQCFGPDNAACLTEAQVETARKIYAGARLADGTQVYGGLEPGSELNWKMLVGGPGPFHVNEGYFRAFVYQDMNWDFHNFDLERDLRLAVERTGAVLDANDPNLKPFKDKGGKLIMYQAWNENSTPPGYIQEYYRNVEKAMGGRSQTQDFARLFMVAGTGGCPGLFNSEEFKALEAVQNWVEKGIAPDTILVSHINKGKVERTRPACAYPKVARYKGSGDPNSAANFSCVDQDK
jgi:feruloyl esterase